MCTSLDAFKTFLDFDWFGFSPDNPNELKNELCIQLNISHLTIYRKEPRNP